MAKLLCRLVVVFALVFPVSGAWANWLKHLNLHHLPLPHHLPQIPNPVADLKKDLKDASSIGKLSAAKMTDVLKNPKKMEKLRENLSKDIKHAGTDALKNGFTVLEKQGKIGLKTLKDIKNLQLKRAAFTAVNNTYNTDKALKNTLVKIAKQDLNAVHHLILSCAKQYKNNPSSSRNGPKCMVQTVKTCTDNFNDDGKHDRDDKEDAETGLTAHDCADLAEIAAE